MKFTLLCLCFSFFCHGQTEDIVFTTISQPKQKDLYPQNYWNAWEKDLPRTEYTIKKPETGEKRETNGIF